MNSLKHYQNKYEVKGKRLGRDERNNMKKTKEKVTRSNGGEKITRKIKTLDEIHSCNHLLEGKRSTIYLLLT